MQVFDPTQTYATIRHKLFWVHCTSDSLDACMQAAQQQGIPCVNVGKELAQVLQNMTRNKYLHLNAKDAIDKIIRTAKDAQAGSKTRSIVLYNLSILLEPELDLDPGQIIKEHAKDCALVLFWDGFSDDGGNLYWQTADTQNQLRFLDTPVVQVTLPNAI